MKDREIVCRYYEAEGYCKLGRAGTFNDKCQKCNKYVAAKGKRPRRTDNRGYLLKEILRKEEKRGEFDE